MKKKMCMAAGMCLAAILLSACVFIEEEKMLENNKDIGTEADGETWQVFQTLETDKGMQISIVGENLLQKESVSVKVDSEENENTTADMLRDGICDDDSLRWSSDNDWEDNEHWVEVAFPQKMEVGSIRLYWERRNALEYAIEVSEDGKQWSRVVSFQEAPEEKCQDIVFDKAIETAYLRLYIWNVNKAEEDGSLYYQNVSLLEMEVYGAFTQEFTVETPVIGTETNRVLQMPLVAEGYELTFAGCDYENVIDNKGRIADTLSDVAVEIGYRLSKNKRSKDLPAMKVVVPQNIEWESLTEADKEDTAEEAANLPEGYEPMEWCPMKGSYELADSCNIYIRKDSPFRNSAGILAEELEAYSGKTVTVVEIEEETALKEEAAQGHIYLKQTEDTLPKEGYRLYLGTKEKELTVIEAEDLQGVRWGCVSFLDLLKKSEVLPRGVVCDYPRYQVRGFGIDVARRAIPMEFLYRLVRDMSSHKMNTLLLHLNDNQIIAQSEHGGTIEGVRNLYSAFRLESDLTGENGVPLTAGDLFYTKEEFKEFVKYAADYGIEVVPEIDTPAHSLAIIKAFPHTGKTEDVFTADQLDISKEDTKAIVKNIWREYLKDGENSVFADCKTVHMGMDEYFGDGEEFVNYMAEISSYIKELSPDKNIRMWGSLTGANSDYGTLSKDLEIQLWSLEWANPLEMYEAGFSIINSQKNHLYIIPGSGYNWLDETYLEKEWEVNVFEDEKRRWEIPSYSPQMLGACYMMWNDMILIDGIALSEEDLYERFYAPLDEIADKLWN